MPENVVGKITPANNAVYKADIRPGQMMRIEKAFKWRIEGCLTRETLKLQTYYTEMETLWLLK